MELGAIVTPLSPTAATSSQTLGKPGLKALTGENLIKMLRKTAQKSDERMSKRRGLLAPYDQGQLQRLFSLIEITENNNQRVIQALRQDPATKDCVSVCKYFVRKMKDGQPYRLQQKTIPKLDKIFETIKILEQSDPNEERADVISKIEKVASGEVLAGEGDFRDAASETKVESIYPLYCGAYLSYRYSWEDNHITLGSLTIEATASTAKLQFRYRWRSGTGQRVGVVGSVTFAKNILYLHGTEVGGNNQTFLSLERAPNRIERAPAAARERPFLRGLISSFTLKDDLYAANILCVPATDNELATAQLRVIPPEEIAEVENKLGETRFRLLINATPEYGVLKIRR